MPKVTFKPNRLLKESLSIEVPEGTTILEAAEDSGAPVGSNCGGVCGCSTCHVYVLEGFKSLEEMEDREADRLDLAFDVRLHSRLGCQAEIAGEDVVVEITEESLRAFLDENPKVRKEIEKTGEFVPMPRKRH